MLQVLYAAALHTDQVYVGRHGGVKSALIMGQAELLDQAHILEDLKGPINRGRADSGMHCLDPFVDFLRPGMAVIAQNQPAYGYPLRCGLEAISSQGLDYGRLQFLTQCYLDY